MSSTPPFENAPLVRPELQQLRTQINSVIRGKEPAVDLLLVGVLAKGHLLLEDVPGVGKTTLAKTLAATLDLNFSRVQFTPDLLPADIIGSQLLNPKDGSFRFHAGPIFTNILLADEINRASPRTQSALLEAMNEAQVTIDGTTHPLADPFLVIATQNPIDFQGTYPLPEAQLDRFLLRFALGYPHSDDEIEILYDRQLADPLTDLQPCLELSQLLSMQHQVRQVTFKREVAAYLLRIAEESRKHPGLSLGVSPRGALACFRAAQALAYLRNRDYVSPADIQELAEPVLSHRLLLSSDARYGGQTTASLLTDILQKVDIPV